MKRTMIALLAVFLLAGCSRETQVWLPEEEVVELQGKDVVRIPMDTETEPSAEPQPQPAEKQEPAPTQQPETEKVSITKKPTTTPKKNTSNKTTTSKDTISGTGTGKPVATEPTVTKPAATEPTATKPVATEPVATEPVTTEPPVTEPIPTEPPVTEPPVTEPPLYDISDYQLGNLEYELLDRVNEYREEAELEPLWLDTWLCAIASCRSFEASQIWSHTRPDGRHFATVLDDYGYAAGSVQELMVYDTGSGDGTAIADRWMESKTHRELLLSGYTTAGIGVYDLDGITYVTCLLVQ